MKAIPLALACALLSASALVPAAVLAQTAAPATESSPSTSASTPPVIMQNPSAGAPAAGARDEDGRRWRASQKDDSEDMSSWRGAAGHDSDWDDEDDDDMDSTPSRDGRGMASGGAGDGDHARGGHGDRDMDREAMRGESRQDGDRMSPEMMRLHARMMARRAMGGGGMGMGAQGAHLKLNRGNASIDIACPASETVNACVDAVSKLMDKLHAMPQSP